MFRNICHLNQCKKSNRKKCKLAKPNYVHATPKTMMVWTLIRQLTRNLEFNAWLMLFSKSCLLSLPTNQSKQIGIKTDHDSSFRCYLKLHAKLEHYNTLKCHWTIPVHCHLMWKLLWIEWWHGICPVPYVCAAVAVRTKSKLNRVGFDSPRSKKSLTCGIIET